MSAPGVRPMSVITDYGEAGSSCGYCGSKRPTSVQHGMMAESLSVEAYQALLDRWEQSRASGCACAGACAGHPDACWGGSRLLGCPASRASAASARTGERHSHSLALPQGLAAQRALGLLPGA